MQLKAIYHIWSLAGAQNTYSRVTETILHVGLSGTYCIGVTLVHFNRNYIYWEPF